MSPHRSAADSRCSQPEGAPYRWIDHVDKERQAVRRMDDFIASLIPPVRVMEEGEIEELFDAASAGELEAGFDEYEPLKPIRSDPDIYELRLKSLRTYRFYHGEPLKYPDLLVALNRHIKDEATDQQAEIEAAIERYHPKD